MQQGYQITFFLNESRRHHDQLLSEWLIELARSMGIPGATMFSGAMGFGRDRKFHSAHFFELDDQPVQLVMAMNSECANQLFARLRAENINLFYIKSAIEFGMTHPDPEG